MYPHRAGHKRERNLKSYPCPAANLASLAIHIGNSSPQFCNQISQALGLGLEINKSVHPSVRVALHSGVNVHHLGSPASPPSITLGGNVDCKLPRSLQSLVDIIHCLVQTPLRHIEDLLDLLVAT